MRKKAMGNTMTTPVPDPTVLTTQQLQREVASTREILEAILNGTKLSIETRLQAAKEAVGEQNKSNALAIAKSEATFTKQIDQIGVLISAMQKGIDDKIDDIKTRLQSIESHRKGSNDILGYVVAFAGLAIAAFAFFLNFKH